jgi:hypothetical protein
MFVEKKIFYTKGDKITRFDGTDLSLAERFCAHYTASCAEKKPIK